MEKEHKQNDVEVLIKRTNDNLREIRRVLQYKLPDLSHSDAVHYFNETRIFWEDISDTFEALEMYHTNMEKYFQKDMEV